MPRFKGCSSSPPLASPPPMPGLIYGQFFINGFLPTFSVLPLAIISNSQSTAIPLQYMSLYGSWLYAPYLLKALYGRVLSSHPKSTSSFPSLNRSFYCLLTSLAISSISYLLTAWLLLPLSLAAGNESSSASATTITIVMALGFARSLGGALCDFTLTCLLLRFSRILDEAEDNDNDDEPTTPDTSSSAPTCPDSSRGPLTLSSLQAAAATARNWGSFFGSAIAVVIYLALAAKGEGYGNVYGTTAPDAAQWNATEVTGAPTVAPTVEEGEEEGGGEHSILWYIGHPLTFLLICSLVNCLAALHLVLKASPWFSQTKKPSSSLSKSLFRRKIPNAADLFHSSYEVPPPAALSSTAPSTVSSYAPRFSWFLAQTIDCFRGDMHFFLLLQFVLIWVAFQYPLRAASFDLWITVLCVASATLIVQLLRKVHHAFSRLALRRRPSPSHSPSSSPPSSFPPSDSTHSTHSQLFAAPSLALLLKMSSPNPAYQWSAFVYFLFQEVPATIQIVGLAGSAGMLLGSMTYERFSGRVKGGRGTRMEDEEEDGEEEEEEQEEEERDKQNEGKTPLLPPFSSSSSSPPPSSPPRRVTLITVLMLTTVLSVLSSLLYLLLLPYRQHPPSSPSSSSALSLSLLAGAVTIVASTFAELEFVPSVILATGGGVKVVGERETTLAAGARGARKDLGNTSVGLSEGEVDCDEEARKGKTSNEEDGHTLEERHAQDCMKFAYAESIGIDMGNQLSDWVTMPIVERLGITRGDWSQLGTLLVLCGIWKIGAMLIGGLILYIGGSGEGDFCGFFDKKKSKKKSRFWGR